MGWKITDWEKFEVSGDKRSPRKFHNGLDYLQLPVKLHGDKFQELMTWRGGPEAFMVWVLLAEAWATQTRDKRNSGVLWSWQDGRPATIEELAKKVRLPTKTIEAAIPKLLKIQWLEEYTVNTPDLQRKYTVNTPEIQTQTRLDIDKTRQDLSALSRAGFEQFWKTYPKKKSKGQAERAFAKTNPDEQLLATMFAKIEQAKMSEDWRKDNGQFIPYPATWLNAKGWEDVYSLPYQHKDLENRKAAEQRAQWAREGKAIAASSKPQAVRLKEALQQVKNEKQRKAQEHAQNGGQDLGRET